MGAASLRGSALILEQRLHIDYRLRVRPVGGVGDGVPPLPVEHYQSRSRRSVLHGIESALAGTLLLAGPEVTVVQAIARVRWGATTLT